MIPTSRREPTGKCHHEKSCRLSPTGDALVSGRGPLAERVRGSTSLLIAELFLANCRASDAEVSPEPGVALPPHGDGRRLDFAVGVCELGANFQGGGTVRFGFEVDAGAGEIDARDDLVGADPCDDFRRPADGD